MLLRLKKIIKQIIKDIKKYLKPNTKNKKIIQSFKKNIKKENLFLTIRNEDINLIRFDSSPEKKLSHLLDNTQNYYMDNPRALSSLEFFHCLFKNDMKNVIKNTYKIITSIIERSSSNPDLKNNPKLKNSIKQDIEFYITLLDNSLNWSKDFAEPIIKWESLEKNYKFIFEKNLIPLSINTYKALLIILSNHVSSKEVQLIQLLSCLDLYEKINTKFKEKVEFCLFILSLPKRPYKTCDLKDLSKYQKIKIYDLLSLLDRTSLKRSLYENELNNHHDIKKLIKLYSFINDKHAVEQLESMLTSAESTIQSTTDISETYKNLIRSCNFSKAYKFLSDHYDDLIPFINEHVKCCIHQRKFQLLNKLISDNFILLKDKNILNAATFLRLIKLIDIQREIIFINKISTLYSDNLIEVDSPDGYLICNMRDQRALRAMPIAILIEAQKKKWKVVQMNDFILKNDQIFTTKFNSYKAINSKKPQDKLILDWLIDFKEKKAVYNGINYWHGIQEHVRIGTRSYELSFDSKKIQNEFLYRLKTLDQSLSKIEFILSEIPHDMPIRLLMDNPHTTPSSGLRLYIENSQHNDISFVEYTNAYETYGKKISTNYSQRIVVDNLTKNNTSFARMGNLNKFIEWKKNNKINESDEIKHQTHTLNSKQKVFLNKLSTHKKNNKKIYCLIGKTVFDFTDRQDEGCVHKSFHHWLNDTIKYCSTLNDVILLVKPHPHEEQDNVVLFSHTTLKDLVEKSYTNTIILNADFIPMSELISFLDLGILWSGTSVAELAASGINVVTCNKTCEKEIPIGSYVPSSLDQYHQFLNTPYYVNSKEELINNGKFYLRYLDSNSLSLPFRYTSRPISNKNIWPNHLFDEDFEDYFDGKNEVVSKLFSRVID